ncbi:MAG TPA: TonB-dependent receptor [Gemmatimonadaceae bacterium]|nr:TonB-dependent receptor [Gemmatimonadaceae bacterium]
MSHVFSLMAALLLGAAAPQPAPVSGIVRDASSRAPIAGVRVEDVATHASARTDASGRFSLAASLPARLRFSRDGYAEAFRDVTAPGALDVALEPQARALERVTVTALRAQGGAPITEQVITRADVQDRYFGQEMPLLLANTPSFTSYAEQAGYSGYSYIRLRGIDQTRINLTLDGIPLNDPEDEVFYFADLPDFADNLQSVQVQRGVGTSTNGTASYGGSINFESTSLAGAARGGEMTLAAGAWNSRRASLAWNSGLMPSRFAFSARVSDQTTDSYREHAGSKGHSAFVSGGYFGDRDIVKVTAIAGLEHSQLAYDASDAATLAINRRDNPLGPDETDKFGEQVAGITWTHLLTPSQSIATTLYGVSATGYYYVRSSPTELDEYDLDFWWTGAMSTYTYRGDHARLDAGVYTADYHRDHYQYVAPDRSRRVYSNRGIKREASAFVKGAYDVGPLSLFGDVQVREPWWQYIADAHAGIPDERITWRFLNPKVGATYHVTPALSAYASYGVNGREPARGDMLAGADNLDTSNVAFVGGPGRVRPETARDFEGGVRYASPSLALTANVYDMEFRNEIAAIGQLSDLGLPLRKNVPASTRRGVELDARWHPASRLELGVNGAVSDNWISSYTDDASGETYYDVPPLLTPRVSTNQRVSYMVTQAVLVSV